MYNVKEVLKHYNFIDYFNSDQIKILCPFHNEAIPSLNVDCITGAMYCFGCMWHGSIVQFVAKLEKINELQALNKIMKISPLLRTKNFKDSLEIGVSEAWLQFITLPIINWNKFTSHYLIAKRGFKAKTLNHFSVKKDCSARYPIIIPIMENGLFRGYIKRKINSSIGQKYLYNEGFLRRDTLTGQYSNRSPILITEGILDMMKAWQFGCRNVVGILGWKISIEQINKLKQITEVVINGLDNDGRGKEGGEVLKKNFNVINFRYPNGKKDICELNEFEFKERIGLNG